MKIAAFNRQNLCSEFLDYSNDYIKNWAMDKSLEDYDILCVHNDQTKVLEVNNTQGASKLMLSINAQIKELREGL